MPMHALKLLVASIAIAGASATAVLDSQNGQSPISMPGKMSPSIASRPLIEGFRDAYATVNDGKVRLHYFVGGKGPPLLLIPGWPQTAYTWHKIMPELAKRFTVIAVDPRGLGDSSRPLAGYDTDNVAKDLHELMRSLGYR